MGRKICQDIARISWPQNIQSYGPETCFFSKMKSIHLCKSLSNQLKIDRIGGIHCSVRRAHWRLAKGFWKRTDQFHGKNCHRKYFLTPPSFRNILNEWVSQKLSNMSNRSRERTKKLDFDFIVLVKTDKALYTVFNKGKYKDIYL